MTRFHAFANPADAFVDHFHQAAPYIQYLRGKTLVLVLDSAVFMAHSLSALAKDIQLLHSLGIRLVLVYDYRLQLQQLAQQHQYPLSYHQQQLITDETVLTMAKQAGGMIACDLEAALSATPLQTPDHHVLPLTVASGNFLMARPVGVINGVDMAYTGVVRKTDTAAIIQRLDNNQVVMVRPMGYSLSGQAYQLDVNQVAQTLATSLQAEKLIFLGSETGLLDTQQQLINCLTVAEIEPLLQNSRQSAEIQAILRTSQITLENGVQRVHMISGLAGGSLIRELFTHEGCGTALAQNAFVCIRPADQHDIGDILQLIAPLEANGILLPRDHEYLENHIHEFAVLEHDCQVYGCIALHIYADEAVGELGCLIVSPDARARGYGEQLLQYVIQKARQHQLHTLFALSTQTGDWFLERGFINASLADLPPVRQQQYQQNQRQSKIYSCQIASRN
ncbi:amino-acid N-acetyltransferase [Neisseriaceae bacterium ESL0693]|nr:amino-acid N-acetyltransferase [Neisseriaceae bacterium ESL0693]